MDLKKTIYYSLIAMFLIVGFVFFFSNDVISGFSLGAAFAVGFFKEELIDFMKVMRL